MTIQNVGEDMEEVELSCVHTRIHTRMFIADLFIIAKNWKQPKRPSTVEWINRLWYIYTMEYCSAPKINKQLMHATTWLYLKITTLSERSQKKKSLYPMIPFV